MKKLIQIQAALLLACTGLTGCAAIGATGAVGAVGAVAGAAKTYIEYKREGKRPHGLVAQDFEQLRIGMPDADMRLAIGNPQSSSLTPEGWTCHTYGPVLRTGGKPSRGTDYTDTFKVLAVDRGDGPRVAGWAMSQFAVTRPNCEGL